MGFSAGSKKGGGFWNNVNVKITEYEFSPKGPGEKKAGDWVYLVPTVREDGKDKDTNQHLFLGGVKNYEISKDGQSVTSIDENSGEALEMTTYGAKTPAGRFLDTLLENGFPEDELPDLGAGEALNLEAIVGYRIRLVQEVDVEGTKKRGQRVDEKTGKKYDRTNTVVAAVYGNDDAPAKGTGAKTAVKGPKGIKADKGADALAKQTDDAVIAVIEGNVTKANKTGATPVAKLSMGVFRIVKGDNKDAVRKLVNSDDYVAEAVARGAFKYDEENEAVFIEA